MISQFICNLCSTTDKKLKKNDFLCKPCDKKIQLENKKKIAIASLDVPYEGRKPYTRKKPYKYTMSKKQAANIVANQKQVEEVFLKVGTATKAAKLLGVSRERVRQRLNKSTDPEVIKLHDSRRHVKTTEPRCLSCNRSFGKLKGYKNLCNICYTFSKTGVATPGYKYLFQRRCMNCDKPLKIGFRVKGYCHLCYAGIFMRPGRREAAAKRSREHFHVYKNTPKYKAWLEKNREKKQLYAKRYQLTHREELKIKNKLKHDADPEKWKAYNRKIYHKRMARMTPEMKQEWRAKENAYRRNLARRKKG